MYLNINEAVRPVSLFRLLVLGSVALCTLFCAVSEADDAKSPPDGSFRVGYRILDLERERGTDKRPLSVAVWYPTPAASERYTYGGPTAGNVALDAEPYAQGGPYPLLVFSHGYGGSGMSAVFLTEKLAARGWIVVAPDHHDRDSVVRLRSGRQPHFDRFAFFRHAREITGSTPGDRDAYSYRLDELKLALDRIVESELFGPLIDKEKIAVGGHSFGGFTALGLCGTIRERHDRRIRGVLLFSTGAGGYLFRDEELAAVKMPSLLFLGESERNQKRGTSTMARLSEKIYTNLSRPKHLLEVRGANHFSFNSCFTDRIAERAFFCGSEEQFEVIRRYSIAFLEEYVARRQDLTGTLEHQDSLLTRYLKEP